MWWGDIKPGEPVTAEARATLPLEQQQAHDAYWKAFNAWQAAGSTGDPPPMPPIVNRLSTLNSIWLQCHEEDPKWAQWCKTHIDDANARDKLPLEEGWAVDYKAPQTPTAVPTETAPASTPPGVPWWIWPTAIGAGVLVFVLATGRRGAA